MMKKRAGVVCAMAVFAILIAAGAHAGLYKAAIWDVLEQGVEYEFDVSNHGIDFENVKFVLNNNFTEKRINVEQIEEMPSTIDEAPGLIHSRVKIISNIYEGELENATIRFRVSRQWLYNQSLPEDSVVLKRYGYEEWESLPAKLVGGASDYFYYTAVSTGFRYFAITAEESSMPIDELEVPEENETAEEPDAEEPEPELIAEVSEPEQVEIDAEPEQIAESNVPIVQDLPSAAPRKVPKVSTASKVLKFLLVGILILAFVVMVVQNLKEKNLKKKY